MRLSLLNLDLKSKLLAAAACIAAIGCGGAKGTGAAGPYTGAQPTFSQTDLTTGQGTRAARTARITVNYTGWVYDPNKPDHKGSQFDTSIGRGPFSFTLGAGEVIPGWDQGFNDMRVGGKRRLIIPTEMGYGAQGTPDGSIPPNAPLVFEMELLDVK
jgi:FKBP-type peptidyl-prolyl cis-trans isomerase FkpA